MGAWALHRGGVSTEHIAHRTVVFFLVTSAANFAAVIVAGLGLAFGLVPGRASLALAEKKLSDATIRSPFPGAVKTRSVHPGEYLRLQSPVMVVVRTDKLRARLPESQIRMVRIGYRSVRSFGGRQERQELP